MGPSGGELWSESVKSIDSLIIPSPPPPLIPPATINRPSDEARNYFPASTNDSADFDELKETASGDVTPAALSNLKKTAPALFGPASMYSPAPTTAPALYDSLESLGEENDTCAIFFAPSSLSPRHVTSHDGTPGDF